jgi:hypothetical protein
MTQRMKNTTNTLLASAAAGVVAAETEVLTPEQEQELAACALRIGALGRRSTAQTFEYGAELAKVQAILPAKRFGAWLKVHVGFSTKSAKNYTRVHHELAWYRERMEAAALPSAAMFALLGADEADIEEVLETIESGEYLTVAKIKTMVAGEAAQKPAAIDPLNMPGRTGCLKVAEKRMKDQIDLFYGLLTRVLVHVESAVETFASGKNVAKTSLAEKIEIDCRHANDLFGLTLAPIYINESYVRLNWKASEYGVSSAWGRLQRALRKLGGSAEWPERQAFRPWVVDEVYPLLKFVVRGEPLADGVETSPEEIEAEARAIRAKELQRDLDKTRVMIDLPSGHTENVVDMTSRHSEPADDKTAAA